MLQPCKSTIAFAGSAKALKANRVWKVSCIGYETSIICNNKLNMDSNQLQFTKENRRGNR